MHRMIHLFAFVGVTRLELATSRPPDAYSNQLSYTPIMDWPFKLPGFPAVRSIGASRLDASGVSAVCGRLSFSKAMQR